MSDVSKTNEDLLGFIDQTLYANEGGGWFWTNAEVIKLLHEIRAIAARVPVQGEPNDEPCLGCGSAAEDGHDYCTVTIRTIRATVPDAATEKPSREWLEDVAETHAFCADRLTIEVEKVERALAERDAALAAIERIREAVSGQPECDRYSEDDVISCGWKSAYASVLAALDGAPEPEWEYQWGEPGESFEGFDSFATEELARAEMELDSEYPSHRVMRRRKAGPWEACNE